MTTSNLPSVPARGPIRGFARSAALLALCAALAPSALMGGCEEKKKPAPPPPPPPPPKVVAPDPIKVDGVLQSMKPDARVQFPQASAPYNEDAARAIISFADALAKGDSDSLRRMLGPSGQGVLDRLSADGDWEAATKKIEGVRVVSVNHAGPNAPSFIFGLAIQEPGSAYALRWEGTKTGSDWVIEPMSCTSETKSRASDFDGQSLEDNSMTASAPPPPEAEPAAAGGPAPAAKAAEPAPSAPSAPAAPGPRRKSTPAGPVTIPGGG